MIFEARAIKAKNKTWDRINQTTAFIQQRQQSRVDTIYRMEEISANYSSEKRLNV